MECGDWNRDFHPALMMTNPHKKKKDSSFPSKYHVLFVYYRPPDFPSTKAFFSLVVADPRNFNSLLLQINPFLQGQ